MYFVSVRTEGTERTFFCAFLPCLCRRDFNRVLPYRQDPLLMYPEEGKKIGHVNDTADDQSGGSDPLSYYPSTTTTPLPPPRHKPDGGKSSNFNLIEL